MRSRFVPVFLLALTAGLVMPAFAQDDGPRVDIVEVTGTIDAPIARYVRERIADAEDQQLDLLVLQIDSPGLLKASALDEDGLPDLVARVRDATVPIAVFVGPRNAHAAGGAVALLEAAHIAGIGTSALLDLTVGFELASATPISDAELSAIVALGTARGRTIDALEPTLFGPIEAQAAGLVDIVAPSAAELLVEANGRTVQIEGRSVTLGIPSDLTTVRFWQPGPIRRGLHTIASPIVAYFALIAAIMLIVFESSQPGFGVAGGTAVLLGGMAVYGFTVLPATWWAMGLLLAGSALLWLDVVRDELLLPTWLGLAMFGAGSVFLLPGPSSAVSLPRWLALTMTAAAFVFFAPIMTLVKRQRLPIAPMIKRALIGESGDVRSMLNPEGYVMVSGELWRARLAEGGRLRVGETITVTGVDGAVLLVAGSDGSSN